MEEVRSSLRLQNCQISPRSYQEFVGRVLRVLSLGQAHALGVDIDLLRAIRVRYQLPIDPKRPRKATCRSAPRHDSRARRRRIMPKPEPRPARSPAKSPAANRGLAVAQASTPERQEVAVPVPPKLRGTLDDPQGWRDWKIINDMARKKVFAKDRSMVLNYYGTVTHTRTRLEYTESDLQEMFGLTKNEAESCFMTFVDDTRPA